MLYKSTFTTNLHEKGLHERSPIRNIKKLFLKKWGFIVCFLLAMLWINPLAAINLTVSGITSPNAANGTYSQQSGTINGKNYWKHSSGNYYIYFDSNYFTWNIDTDTDYTSVLFYSAGNESSPAGASYSGESGTGTPNVVESGLPEITVSGNGTTIGDGDNYPTFAMYTKFGSVNVSSGTVTRNYTIKNDGTANLTISGVTITGANSGDFTITASPATTVAASGQTTLSVRFDPSATGSRMATINIASNDADEATYNFDIQGYGYTPSNLVVSGLTIPSAMNGIYVHQGVLNGQYEYWKHSSASYYIYQDVYSLQPGWWFIDSDTNPSSFLYRQYYGNSPATAKDVNTWADPSTQLFSITIVDYVAAPEINLYGNSISITNNDATTGTTNHTHFGTAEVGVGSITRTFTIQNIGGTNLQLTSTPIISLSGANASDFAVTTLPGTPITSGNITSFQITFTPLGEGGRTATVSIANNDSNENPFTFAIKGGGVYAKGLTVSGVNNTGVNGNYTYQGITDGFATWVHTSGTYRIYNSLYEPLNRRTWRIDADTNPDNGVCFASPEFNSDPAPIGIVPSSWALGTIGGENFSGSPVVVYFASEINIQGNGNSIANGDVTPTNSDYTDFGFVPASSGNLSHTFTIQNTGSGSLYLTGTPKVAVSGANAGDFTVSSQPTSPVAASSGTTPFTVQFTPSGTGIRTATLTVVNDDSDESTYSFSIQGTGVITPTVTTQAVSNIGATVATGNGNITNLGYPGPTSFGICWGTSANPTIADNKTDIGTATTTGAFTSQLTGLNENTAYHARAYVTNSVTTSYGDDLTFTTFTAGRFTGAVNSDWATAGNWAGGSVPTSSTDVLIPAGKAAVISDATSANCKNISVDGTLTLVSSASGSGSLMVNGTATGNVTFQRYLTGNKWQLISPTAAGQSVAAFLAANANIPTNMTTGKRGLMDYNTLLNNWNEFYPNTGASGTMEAGKGFSARTSANGTVSFTGTLTTGTKNLTLSNDGKGWNCIGNPYTSAIGINSSASTTNFIDQNDDQLDPSYTCIYIWDEDAAYSGTENYYKIISNAGFSLPGETNLLQNYIAPGQGFLVKAPNSGPTSVSFTSAMQSHQPAIGFKSGAISWPGFELTAASANAKASAIITFNNQMSKGLDVGFDAGLLRATNEMNIYSRLVNDNGVDFAIQCLPETGAEQCIIPIGLEVKKAGEVRFSAKSTTMPAGCSIFLEDRMTKTRTELTPGKELTVNVAENTSGTGRFYLYLSSITTGNELTPDESFRLKAFPANEKIWIEGKVSSKAEARLFDSKGTLTGLYKLEEGSRNNIPATGLTTGIYILKVTDGKNTFTTKLMIN